MNPGSTRRCGRKGILGGGCSAKTLWFSFLNRALNRQNRLVAKPSGKSASNSINTTALTTWNEKPLTQWPPNQKGLGDRAWQCNDGVRGGGGLICPGAGRNQSPEATDMALAYSEANSSLSGYCSLNSRNNLCARAFCLSRRAARARIILANGRR
jgi:hypothetical protein